jgi:hypothetical protein
MAPAFFSHFPWFYPFLSALRLLFNNLPLLALLAFWFLAWLKIGGFFLFI